MKPVACDYGLVYNDKTTVMIGPQTIETLIYAAILNIEIKDNIYLFYINSDKTVMLNKVLSGFMNDRSGVSILSIESKLPDDLMDIIVKHKDTLDGRITGNSMKLELNTLIDKYPKYKHVYGHIIKHKKEFTEKYINNTFDTQVRKTVFFREFYETINRKELLFGKSMPRRNEDDTIVTDDDMVITSVIYLTKMGYMMIDGVLYINDIKSSDYMVDKIKVNTKIDTVIIN